MKKSPITAMLVLLIVIVIAFSSCDISMDLPGKGDDIKAGETIVDDEGNVIPVVTVVEVTDDKGEVVETEVVTLSSSEIQIGKDFFSSSSNKAEVPTGAAPERVTKPSAETTVKNEAEKGDGDKDNNSNNENGSNEQNKETTQAQAPVIPDDLDIITSTKYTVVGRVEKDGVSTVYKVARDGNKYAAVMFIEGQEMGVIVGETDVYLVIVEEKGYITVPKSLIEQEAGDDAELQAFLSGDAFNMTKKVIGEATEEADGITYRVVKYDDGSSDYLNGKTLVKTLAKDGSVLYYDTITSEVSAGVFLPPVGYTEQKLTEENVSDLADSLTTTHAHSHDE